MLMSPAHADAPLLVEDLLDDELAEAVEWWVNPTARRDQGLLGQPEIQTRPTKDPADDPWQLGIY